MNSQSMRAGEYPLKTVFLEFPVSTDVRAVHQRSQGLATKHNAFLVSTLVQSTLRIKQSVHRPKPRLSSLSNNNTWFDACRQLLLSNCTAFCSSPAWNSVTTSAACW
jgi:hypothetical protein